MNKAIIGIGSNLEDAKQRVEECCKDVLSMVDEAKFSSIYETEAVGSIPQPNYYNCVGVLATSQTFEELKQKLKDYERLAGRLPEHKSEGKVIIDIDIVVWNTDVIKPTDLSRSYMTIGMDELNISASGF
ncbi:MAG: 2-amino-4-hydroxy-6-hydroxymethyldihydropteridine diphosphokinase [Bacteroidales bacterium]|nr:2-amino-4-hydroxy-6-hydroxymethyldihydropteridine diphosphokinase [Bacteroidales bacterium]